MKVVICWPYISGYMAACWRALSARPGIDVAIIGFKSDGAGYDIKFQDNVVGGLNIQLIDPNLGQDADAVRSLVLPHRPDIVVLSGWAYTSYRELVEVAELSAAKFIMTMDTPYRGTFRQRLGRFVMGRFLSRLDRVVVPGERAWQLARQLGIPEAKMRRGLYGVDYSTFAPLLEQRRMHSGGWPRNFLFVGRYQPEKGIDILLAAYQAYRATVAEPWGLTCCGSGPLERQIDAAQGVTNLGFVQPAQQPQVFAAHGVFVLASRFDPWPLVIVEACAAGLPVIHSEACGSAVELVRPYFNGLGVATEDVEALSAAMRWCHEHLDRLPEMGARGQPLAAAYSAEAWADRWVTMLQELCDAG